MRMYMFMFMSCHVVMLKEHPTPHYLGLERASLLIHSARLGATTNEISTLPSCQISLSKLDLSCALCAVSRFLIKVLCSPSRPAPCSKKSSAAHAEPRLTGEAGPLALSRTAAHRPIHNRRHSPDEHSAVFLHRPAAIARSISAARALARSHAPARGPLCCISNPPLQCVPSPPITCTCDVA